jgi:hypothetical protein
MLLCAAMSLSDFNTVHSLLQRAALPSWISAWLVVDLLLSLAVAASGAWAAAGLRASCSERLARAIFQRLGGLVALVAMLAAWRAVLYTWQIFV